MANNNQIDCISPNTGAPFDKWSNTTPAQLQASLDTIQNFVASSLTLFTDPSLS